MIGPAAGSGAVRAPRILVLAGTRPECIKLASLVDALRATPHVTTRLTASGQHPAMVQRTFLHLGCKVDTTLPPVPAGNSLSRSVRHLRDHAMALASAWQADAIVVQGDTSTAYAGALAGRAAGIDVAHVEAGLRTATPMRPFPEEPFRRRITALARWHFAPTAGAAEHLLAEGTPAASVHVVGNTVVDMLRRAVEGMPETAAVPDRPLVLTLHRRENYGKAMDHVCTAVLDLLALDPALRLVCPVHPNPMVGTRMRRLLGGHPRISLVEPMDHVAFIGLLASAALVITDSGGIQEEAPYLGVPVLVVRETTERPEALRHGGIRLVAPEREAVVDAARATLAGSRPGRQAFDQEAPFGDGRSGARIARLLIEALQSRHRHPDEASA